MTLEFNKMYKILEAREVTRVTPQSPNVKDSSGQQGKETLVELIVSCAEGSGDGAVMSQTVVNFSMRQLPSVTHAPLSDCNNSWLQD